MTQQLISNFQCVSPSPAAGGVCGGNLEPIGQGLSCIQCQRIYPVVQGVPLLHPNPQTTEKNEWFEQMYQGRSRSEEIQCDYLSKERSYVARFCKERSICGPSLEIGCGVGLFAELVAGFIGLEYSLESLLAPGFESFDRIAGDAACLPFKDAAMQFVFSFNTLEHIGQIDLVFSELDRVCAPGGYLLLKPAWHCTKYHTELVDILPYSKLSLRKKIVKILIPLLRTRVYKFFSHVPWRLWRRLTAGTPPVLKWTPLVPYHGPLWEADTDAEVSLDSHESILYFVRRGYECLSHAGMFRQLLAGHDIVVLRKPND